VEVDQDVDALGGKAVHLGVDRGEQRLVVRVDPVDRSGRLDLAPIDDEPGEVRTERPRLSVRLRIGDAVTRGVEPAEPDALA
jgi:hypothetical protein